MEILGIGAFRQEEMRLEHPLCLSVPVRREGLTRYVRSPGGAWSYVEQGLRCSIKPFEREGGFASGGDVDAFHRSYAGP